MANAAAGRYYLNGKDLFTVFGIGIKSGSDDFLKFPKRKESITHDWLDAHGLDVDTSRVFFEAKQVTLDCWMVAGNEAEFWTRYNGFLAEMAQPGVHRLTISELSQSFFIIYIECPDFERPTNIKGTNFIGCFFKLTLLEQEPRLNPQDVFIVDEDGRFLVT